ncbi:ROK family transcriptional regulator [Sinomonas sp. JGH33]|uniref:ROK family transcriptional regulator n=1 Tax=Sinomonas terricola TaxID=3110330 RepID=A0ABU5T8N6_9MICC|nr:ROK family transcriptional regulator [Sinomonas sp. JGH33]MEA5455451.1 ROK family transcriptional regulator [Sinomonas sp. JGH33]
MGDFNLTVILDAIRRSEAGMSRVELAQLVGLSPQTISNISRRLLDQKLIVEAGKEGSGPGKPRTILRLNPSGMYAIGVHLDPALITVVLLDLVGSVVEKRTFVTPQSHEPAEIVAAIAECVEELISLSGVSRSLIAGLGVAAPGPIDLDRGAVVGPPLLRGWVDVNLQDMVQTATGLPTTVDKDVTGAAVAEIWAGGPGGSGSFVFFYLGTGLGCGLVLNGEVYRGSSGNAGEIGHIIVDPDGPLCSDGCGMRGTIGTVLEPQVLVSQAVVAGILPVLPPNPTAREFQAAFARLSELVREGDETAIGIMSTAARSLAWGASVVGNLVDVERLVFGGPFWAPVADFVLDVLPNMVNDLLATRGIHHVDLAGTRLGEDVGAVGAACLVLERALAPRAERLLLEG